MTVRLTWTQLRFEGAWVSAYGKYGYRIEKKGRWPNVQWTPMVYGRTKLRVASPSFDGTNEWVEFNPRPTFKEAKEVCIRHATQKQEVENDPQRCHRTSEQQ